MSDGTPRTATFRRAIVVALVVLLGSAVLAPGAVAHVGETFSHLWRQHIKPRLATPGTVNAAANPVDWTKLKGVPPGLADGQDDRGIEQAVGASGGGPNPSGVVAFFGHPAHVVVTSPSQSVLVASTNGFGTSGAPAVALNLFICRRELPSGSIEAIGNGILGNALPANTRVTMGMTRIVQLAPGEYEVGLCGTGAAGWNNNDWGSTSALVIST